MNHDMTVQNKVTLQNIRPVSDLGSHMELAQILKGKYQIPCGFCRSHCYKIKQILVTHKQKKTQI